MAGEGRVLQHELCRLLEQGQRRGAPLRRASGAEQRPDLFRLETGPDGALLLRRQEVGEPVHDGVARRPELRGGHLDGRLPAPAARSVVLHALVLSRTSS